MNSAAEDRYLARFRKVFEYIDAHLDEDLRAEHLSGIAAFSKFHFHRQFTELFGISVYRYVQLSRLKRAAYQLAFRDDSQIVDIALANGYEGPEAFARAFRKSTGQSPSQFRTQPQWVPWLAACQPLGELRNRYMNTQRQPSQVDIKIFKETRVAVLEHRGDPRLMGDSIRKFIEWRKQNNLSPRVTHTSNVMSHTFNILYDDPDTAEPAEFRLDLCASTEREVAPNDVGVVTKVIPGGRCAVIRHVGSDDTLNETLKYLYSSWLPHSGEELRDYPLYIQRVRFFPDVPEHEAIIDAFLPLK